MIDSGFLDSESKVQGMKQQFREDVALHTNPSITTPEEFAKQFGVSNFTELPKSTQEMFKQYASQKMDAHQLNLDIKMLARFHDLDHWMKLKVPMALVRAEHGLSEKSTPYINQQEAQILEKNLPLKASYVAKGATHYNMLWNDEHCKQIAKLIDRVVGRYDIHRWGEMKFQELKYVNNK